MNQLFEVSAGMANQNAGISDEPDDVSTRIDGTGRHAHTAYRPANGHASGRPSDASTSSANASRGRLREVAVDRRQAQGHDQRIGAGDQDQMRVVVEPEHARRPRPRRRRTARTGAAGAAPVSL